MMSNIGRFVRRYGNGAATEEPKYAECNSPQLGEVTMFRCAGRIAFGHLDKINAVSKWACSQMAVLDLAHVTEIDAAGIGAIVCVRKQALANGVALKLMNLTPKIEELLKLTGLRCAFEICSVPEMLGLLCRAFEQSQLVSVKGSEDSERVFADGIPALAESA